MATEQPEVAIATMATEKTSFITTDLPTPEASPTFAHKDTPTVHLIDIPNLSDHDHDTPAPPYSNTPAQDAAPVEATVDPLASALLHARSQHMARLTSMYAEMELAAREHDAHLSALYQAEIATLQAQIDAGVAEQKALKQRLVEVTEHKKMEINALRAEMQAAKVAFDEELETRRREAQALLEAMLAEERSRSEEALAGERQRGEAELSGERERSMEELEALKKAEEERVNTLMKEMTHEADERVRAVQSEMMIEMEAKMKALSEEMERMKREFASEREHNARAMKVLAEKEAEARRRAESSERHKQPLQAWAVARLWGVGQGRSR